MKNICIDNGKNFDWGQASEAYAEYRDIYPQEFYSRILDAGLCVKGQDVLDLGTGTGVLPRHLYPYGANFTGADISEKQIQQAVRLSREAGMEIPYVCAAAEQLPFPDASFDVVTACQCFFYFNHDIAAEKIYNVLKPEGKLAVLYMAWLPLEDRIAALSEELVLKYNPSWSGGQETRRPNAIPRCYAPYFDMLQQEVCDLAVPFTRASWNGRMLACRGIGASLPEKEQERFSREHRELLDAFAPAEFTIRHYLAMSILQARAGGG